MHCRALRQFEEHEHPDAFAEAAPRHPRDPRDGDEPRARACLARAGRARHGDDARAGAPGAPARGHGAREARRAPTLDGVEEGLWHLRLLERRGVRILNPATALVSAHDKLLTARRLADAGVPSPRTVHLTLRPRRQLEESPRRSSSSRASAAGAWTSCAATTSAGCCARSRRSASGPGSHSTVRWRRSCRHAATTCACSSPAASWSAPCGESPLRRVADERRARSRPSEGRAAPVGGGPGRRGRDGDRRRPRRGRPAPGRRRLDVLEVNGAVDFTPAYADCDVFGAAVAALLDVARRASASEEAASTTS